MEEFVLINTERMIKFKNHLAIPNEIITLCTDHLWMLQPSDEKLICPLKGCSLFGKRFEFHCIQTSKFHYYFTTNMEDRRSS